MHSYKTEEQWPEPGRGRESERTEDRYSFPREDTPGREGQARRAAEGDCGKVMWALVGSVIC